MKFCSIHNTYYGGVNDTIPMNKCPVCHVMEHLQSQSAPRTYEVANSMAVIQEIERHAPYIKPTKEHVWDRDGERCVNCGQKDWMGGSECRPLHAEQWVITFADQVAAYTGEDFPSFSNWADAANYISEKTYRRRAPALAPFEKLVEEWRNHSALDAIGRLEQSDKAITLDSCADRLSAVVEEVRGK